MVESLGRSVSAHPRPGVRVRIGVDMSAGLRRELSCERPDAATRADDQHGLSGERPKRLNDLEGSHARSRQRCRHHRVELLRHPDEVGALADRDVLGVRAGGSKRRDEQLAEGLGSSMTVGCAPYSLTAIACI